MHHEAEELRVHDRATIPEMTARHVMEDLLASGQVARMNAGWLVSRPPGSRPTLQRSWGTVCQDGDAAYLVLFLNDRSLLLPLAMTTWHATGFTSTDGAGRKAITLTLHDWPALNGSTGV